MSAVLFVVTIPTEKEEKRLKNEFNARKSDDIDTPNLSTNIGGAEISGAFLKTPNIITRHQNVTPKTPLNMEYGTFPKSGATEIEEMNSQDRTSIESMTTITDNGSSENKNRGSSKQVSKGDKAVI